MLGKIEEFGVEKALETGGFARARNRWSKFMRTSWQLEASIRLFAREI